MERIATAEGCESFAIYDAAREFGYKIFNIQTYAFFRDVIAAPEIKEEDIAEEYADYLLSNNVVISEIELK